MIKHLLLTGVASLALFSFPSKAQAQLYYTNGHADIGIAYEDGELIPHWHGTVGGGSAWNLPEAEYAPDEVIARISNMRNAGSNSASYLGVSTGTPIYVAGLINFQPWVGFGAEELEAQDWNGDLTIKLTGWTLPSGGNFALYTTNAAGTNTADVYLSTFNPSSTTDPWGLGEGPNVFGIGVGGHDHYQFGFTTPGYYEITLEWSGVRTVGGPISASGTFGFQVVPEPSVIGLTAASLVGLLLMRRRKTKENTATL